MSLPVPPPGVNPFPFYKDIFRPPFHPSPGYQPRLIVLGVFIASLPLLAALLFGLHLAKTRRQGEKVWLFKRVKRPAGSYIVGARTPLLCLSVLIISVVIGGAVRGAWRFTMEYTWDTIEFNNFMCAYWILAFIAGWTYSCSNFQTWLLVDGERRFHLSPLVANLIFFGGLALGGSVIIGIASYNRMLNVGFYIVQNRLFAFLQDLGRNYDGTFDPSVLADLGPLASSYGAASAHYFGNFPATLFVFAVSPVPVVLINLSAVFLWLILRRQMRENREMDALAAPGGNTGNSEGSEMCLATSQRRKEMKAIEHGFLVDTVGVFMWSSSVLVTAIWTATIFQHIETASWSRIEACLFLPAWSASVPLAFAMVIQIILAWQGLPPPQHASAEGSGAGLDRSACLPSMDKASSRLVHPVAFGASRDTDKKEPHDLLGEEQEGKDEVGLAR